MRSHTYGFVWPLLVILLTLGGARAAEPGAAQLAAHHTASMQALLPFSCQVQVDFAKESPVGRILSGTYSRTATTRRMRGKLGSIVIDTQVSDGRKMSYSLGQSRGSNVGDSGGISADTSSPMGDAWAYGLLERANSSKSQSVEGWVRGASRASATSEQIEGRRLARVEAETDGRTMTFWLDPSLNYLARRCRSVTRDGKQTDCVADGFTEVAPEVYFPASCRATSTEPGGAATPIWAATFTSISAGRPLPPDALAFKFPPGILVDDAINGTLKRTDAEGKPTLVAKNAKGNTITRATEAPPLAAPEIAEAPKRATAAEPPSRSAWLLPAGVALVGIAVVLWLVRRARRRS